jgi:dihydrofolate reductase
MIMAKLRVHSFSVSLDGFAAGPDQSIDDPFGTGGLALTEWLGHTRTFHRQVLGDDGGETGIEDDLVAAGFEGLGATIMGRNMFGPIRGPWTDDAWKGWWGDNPPYQHPVYVLTHHARDPIPMEGSTTFHFVTDGIEAALERAVEAANGKDVKLAGGASTIQAYLRAGLVDELHMAISPMLLGDGERLLDNLSPVTDRYECRLVASQRAVHVLLTRT